MSDAGSYSLGDLSPDGLWRWDGKQWMPVPAQAAPSDPKWLNIRLRTRGTWLTLAAAVAVGLLFDQAINAGTFGLAATLAILLAAIALLSLSGLNRAEPRLLAVVAGVFGAWLAVRASQWLLWPDLVSAVALLFLAASFAVRGSLLDIGTAELSAKAINALGHLLTGVTFVLRPLISARNRVSALAPVGRGVLIAVPICVVLSILLASADPVFASFFNLNLDLGQFVLHVSLVVIGALAMAGTLRLASAEPVERIDGPAWRLGATEALVVLALLDAVFTAFAAAQVIAAMGAAGATLRSAGVTYADYARSGFFQLLWVGGITLVLLILFSRITGLRKPEHKRAFIVLCEIAIALTLLIVVVAFRRLSLYEDAYGFTMLRLYSHVFAGWIGIVFVLLALEILGWWPRRRWFVGATALSALFVLFALNVANPEAVVVALNVSHAQSSHKFDANYLSELSSDATPAVLQAIPTLEPRLREPVKVITCGGSRSYSSSTWAAFNLSDDQAASARQAGCS